MSTTKTFDYQSTDSAGKRAKGKIDAPSAVAAAQLLRSRGMVPLKIDEAGKGLQRDVKIPGLSGRTTLKDLAVLARQFATLMASGMSLLRGLSVLEQQAVKPALKKALGEVRADIEAGVSLSGALAKQDRVFPALMVAMVRAGETGGFLDKALEQIANTLEKDASLRGKIKSTLTYPAVVLGFSLVMITAVLVFIVPIFEDMFKQVGGDLPLPTQIMVTISHNMLWLGPLVLVVTIVAVVTFRHALRVRPGLRLGYDRMKLRIPVFGSLFTKIAISRFTRNLGTLLAAGVPITQALDVVGATTGNAVISAVMEDLKDAVRDGQPISTPLAKHTIFPAMVTQMIEVGEESGQIIQMLEKIADFYDREVDSAAEALTSALEPIMVLLMGVVVGSMIVCLYLPMFSIYEHIQGVE